MRAPVCFGDLAAEFCLVVAVKMCQVHLQALISLFPTMQKGASGIAQESEDGIKQQQKLGAPV